MIRPSPVMAEMDELICIKTMNKIRLVHYKLYFGSQLKMISQNNTI